jgi:hypothetical protein
VVSLCYSLENVYAPVKIYSYVKELALNIQENHNLLSEL